MNPTEIEDEYLNGIYKEIAELLGIEAALKLHSSFRGQQISFPVNFFTNKFTTAQMVREYNGHNIKLLATKYGYSEKWARKIINDYKKDN